MAKERKKRTPKPGTMDYYIEEVVHYSSKYRAEHGGENGYEPLMAELLLLTCLSIRTIRTLLFSAAGVFIGLLLSSLF